jgi:magnesium-transporting ATPase (P-type)
MKEKTSALTGSFKELVIGIIVFIAGFLVWSMLLRELKFAVEALVSPATAQTILPKENFARVPAWWEWIGVLGWLFLASKYLLFRLKSFFSYEEREKTPIQKYQFRDTFLFCLIFKIIFIGFIVMILATRRNQNFWLSQGYILSGWVALAALACDLCRGVIYQADMILQYILAWLKPWHRGMKVSWRRNQSGFHARRDTWWRRLAHELAMDAFVDTLPRPPKKARPSPQSPIAPD